MSILCKMFGHKSPPPGWGKEAGYAGIKSTVIDGMNIRHATLEAECSRCGKEFIICKVHLPRNISAPE